MDPNDTPNPDALAALDAGIAGDPMPDVDTLKDDVLPDDVKADDEPKGDGEPATPKPDEASKADEPKPGDKKPEEGEPEKEDEPDPVETEIAALGAKGKTAERIRDLSAKVAAAEPLRAELEQLGVKSVEDVQQLARDANNGLEMIELVRKTGADPEEYGFALDWLTMRSRGRSGDVKAAEEAFEVIAQEYATLAKLLNKPVPGVFDPLDEHADLKEEVANGDITQARALEIAGQRNLQAMATQGRKQQDEKQNQAKALTESMEQARVALNTLGAELGKEDADRLAHYHGNGQLKQIIDQVKAKHPNNPEAWATQTELAYRRLPAPPKKEAPRQPGSPVRSGTPITPTVVPDFKDMTPEQALELALSGG